jgi:hypothetical protein
MPNSRFIALIDTIKINYLLAQGEVFVGTKELRELDNALPDSIDYTDLLSDNFTFNHNEDKVFLIIGLIEERDADKGLNVSISEIEYLVALTTEASNILEKRYKSLNFEAIPSFIINNFNSIKIRREASMGVGALRVIMNLEQVNLEDEEPFFICSDNLLDLVNDIPTEIITGLNLKAQNIPYYETNLVQRTLLALTINYKRTLNYPNSDIGYFFDMLEIFHYVTNREDTTPPNIEKITFRKDIYDALTAIYNEDPELELADIATKLDQKQEIFGKFINLITNLTQGNNFLVPFVYLKALDKISKFGASRSLIMGIASDLSTIAEKENFAMRLGATLGFKKLASVLYNIQNLPIIKGVLDLQDVGNGFEVNDSNLSDEDGKDLPLHTESFDVSEVKHIDYVNNTIEQIINTIGHPTPNDINSQGAVNDQINKTPDIAISENVNNTIGITPLLSDSSIDFMSEFDGNDYSNTATIYNFKLYTSNSINKTINAKHKRKEQNSNCCAKRIKLFDSSIALKQKKITNYMISNLAGFTQYLEINPNFTATNPKEIQAAITSLIKNEAPINRTLIISRFKYFCKLANPQSRFARAEKAKVEQELNYVLKNNTNFFVENDFIYKQNSPVYVRFRGYSELNKALKTELRKAKNISSKEIVATYNLLIQFGNLGLTDPTANEVAAAIGINESAENVSYIENLLKELQDCELKNQNNDNTTLQS